MISKQEFKARSSQIEAQIASDWGMVIHLGNAIGRFQCRG